jgi:hypothetical protein
MSILLFRGSKMKRPGNLLKNKNVAAWLLMISAVVVHVFDEAIHDFLPFYNEAILNLRENLGFFPMPTFSLGAWLGGLVVAIVIGFSLTPLVSRGGTLIRALSTLLGILMIINALIHVLGSFYFERLIPGFWSSPFLLITAVIVTIRGLRRSFWKQGEAGR